MTYDPFAAGNFEVRERSFEARDAARNRVFPIEVWQPDSEREEFPLILFSHASMQHRRSATFLCAHLCSHGYVVAAMNHSETVASELARQGGESEEQKLARWQRVMDSRVPDVRFLLSQFATEDPVGIVGHSFGGWTALAVPDVEPRIRAIVALAPGGTSKPLPGILPVALDFDWRRDIPTLVIAAENDTSTLLAGIIEIFDRMPEPKKMIVMRRADHMHFMDDIAKLHERVRTMQLPPDLAEMQKVMLPMAQLTSEEEAHRLVRGWTLAHFDAFLEGNEAARQFLLHA